MCAGSIKMLFIRSNYNVTSNRDAFLAKIIFAAKFVRVANILWRCTVLLSQKCENILYLFLHFNYI